MTAATIDPDVEAMGLDILRLAHDSGEWDMPPAVFIVAKSASGISMHPVTVPHEYWRLGAPPVVLAFIAQMIRKGNAFIAASGEQAEVIGSVFCCETWTLRAAGMSDEEFEAAREWGRTNSYADHPNGQEGRMVVMIDLAGTTAMAEHAREDKPPTECRHGLEGRIPRALTEFMEAIQAHPGAGS